MCEFCHEHGEGKKWYLQAKNYSEDLQSDLLRRMKATSVSELLTASSQGFIRKQYNRLDQRPKWLRTLIRPYLLRYLNNRQKEIHFGQVLPIEDVEHIFDMVNAIVRFRCACRKIFLGKEERYCYGVSMGPPEELLEKIGALISDDYRDGPDTSGLETLSSDEALASFREHELEGCLHTIWTSPTPFVAGFCNCDRSDCGALRSTFSGGVRFLFKAEYVAEVDPELCNGCRQCMRVCQYGAIGSSAAQKKAVIDPLRCAGCGICRASCTKDAIILHDRSASPVAASLW